MQWLLVHDACVCLAPDGDDMMPGMYHNYGMFPWGMDGDKRKKRSSYHRYILTFIAVEGCDWRQLSDKRQLTCSLTFFTGKYTFTHWNLHTTGCTVPISWNIRNRLLVLNSCQVRWCGNDRFVCVFQARIHGRNDNVSRPLLLFHVI